MIFKGRRDSRLSHEVGRQHPLVIKLIVATESGDVAKTNKLLKSIQPATVRSKAASMVLGGINPDDNPILTSYRQWNITPHKIKDKRPGKRSLQSVLKRISRSIGLLLDAGADPNTFDGEAEAVLLKFVCRKELVDVSRILLLAGANPNSRTSYGVSVLYLAVGSGSEECVRLLLHYGAEPGTGFGKSSPLMRAAEIQHIGIMRRLINSGADINCRDDDRRSALMHNLYQHGDHPFMFISRWGRETKARRHSKCKAINITRMLIESGAEYEKPDNMGFLPVDYALVSHLNGLELPTELAVNQTHLMFCNAAMSNDSRQLDALLKSEMIPTRIKSIALTMVAVRGFEKCCKTLLENGADANKISLYESPAVSAAIGLQLQIMKQLVDHGLSKEELNKALQYLCMAFSFYYDDKESVFQTRRLELVRYLLEHGADPNTRDDSYENILTISTVFEDNGELVSLLLEFGAVPT